MRLCGDAVCRAALKPARIFASSIFTGCRTLVLYGIEHTRDQSLCGHTTTQLLPALPHGKPQGSCFDVAIDVSVTVRWRTVTAGVKGILCCGLNRLS